MNPLRFTEGGVAPGAALKKQHLIPSFLADRPISAPTPSSFSGRKKKKRSCKLDHSKALGTKLAIPYGGVCILHSRGFRRGHDGAHGARQAKTRMADTGGIRVHFRRHLIGPDGQARGEDVFDKDDLGRVRGRGGQSKR